VIAGAAAVLGVGLWMPGFPDAAAWLRGQATAGEAAAVPPQRLPPKLRRRTSLLIRMVAEVAAQAVEQAGVSPQSLPIVVGSAYGELGTTIEMLDELEADGRLSPMRFHNSVHNSAVGYLSIAHGNRRSSTSLAAGNETVAMVLLEALALLAESLVPTIGLGALSAALVLRAVAPSSGAPAPGARPGDPARQPLALIGELRQAADPSPGAARSVEVASPSAAILPLLAAILEGRAGRIELAPAGDPPRWSIAVRGADQP
jgi:hypothetical protein